MADFNPDEYLAQQQSSFNPDEYLAQQPAPVEAPKPSRKDSILARFRKTDSSRMLGDFMGGIASGAERVFKPEVINATAGIRRGLMNAPVALGEIVGGADMAEASR